MSNYPKIEIIHGDLVVAAKKEPAQFWAIAHGCNCEKTMGAGIARQIAREFPEAARVDRVTYNKNTPGGLTYAYCKTEDPEHPMIRVVNLYTQHLWAREPGSALFQLEYLLRATRALGMLVKSLHHSDIYEDKVRIGIPRIGCGLGGGNWEEVENLLLKETPPWMRFAVYVL